MSDGSGTTGVDSESPRDWFSTNRETAEAHYDDLRRKRAEVGIDVVEGLSAGPAYLCYRHDDVATVLSDDAFSSDVVADRYAAVLGRRTLIALDRGEHLPLRRRLAAALSGKAPSVQQLVDSVATDVMARLAPGQTVDFAADVAAVIPARVLAGLLGLDPELAGQLGADAQDLAQFGEQPRQGVRAARRLRRLLGDSLATATEQPPRGDGTVITEIAEAVGAGEAAFDEALDALVLLVWAGCETTVPALCTLAYCVIHHAGHFAEVGDSPGTVEAAIEETLRWEAPVQITARRATRSVELGGVGIEEGSLVLAHIGSANRDETWCTEPDAYDVRRVPAPRHLSFGTGFHRCVGNVVAKFELRAVLERLLPHLAALQFAGAAAPAIVGEVVRCPQTLLVRVGE